MHTTPFFLKEMKLNSYSLTLILGIVETVLRQGGSVYVCVCESFVFSNCLVELWKVIK